MCYPVPCRVCGKTTWAGCGDHIAEVRAQVPPEQWCAGHEPVAAAPTQAFAVTAPPAPFPVYPAPKSTNWPSFAALAVAVVALGAAVGAYFTPATASPGTDSAAEAVVAQQSTDAKQKMCDAAGLARVSVQFNTNMTNPAPGDPVGDLAVGTNARLALSHSAQYLHTLLAKEPATPPELATAITNYADTLDELAMGYLSGKSAEDQDPLRNQLISTIDDLDDLCEA